MTSQTGDHARLLALLPEDGTPRPNAELRRQLGVSEDVYWRVRNELLDEGKVVKSRGRGGRTALAVSEDDAPVDMSRVRVWMVATVFGIALVVFFAAVVYAVASWGRERLIWDVLTLVFGAVTFAAAALALLIYKFQEDAASSEAQDQARILNRIQKLTRQAVTSAVDTKSLVQKLSPAVNATDDTEPVQNATRSDEDAFAEATDDSGRDEWTTRVEHGAYYQPPAIPLRLLADLVNWWNSRGETGRWTLSQLVGGYRALNASGTFVGTPWILTFDNGDGQVRSFRITYSGRQKGPSISELAEDGVWRDFGGSNV